MIVYPAIDIRDRKCVRLIQGRYDEMTVFSDDPVKMALKWKNAGAEYLHLVDLDGARSGKPCNSDLIKEIVKATGLFVQAGGGIRNIETVDAYLDSGVKRIIIGTAAIKNIGFLKQAYDKYKDLIAVGIDAKGGYVATDGWEEKSGYKAVDFALKVKKIGIKTIIYTDISRDGMLKGPNIPAMKEMAEKTGLDIIASGGMSNISDVTALKNINMAGVIIGKALYTGNIDLKEALKASRT